MGVWGAAYAAKAEELFGSLMSKPDKVASAVERGFKFLEKMPLLVLGYDVVKEVLAAIIQQRDWAYLRTKLQQLKATEWRLDDQTPVRKRTLDSIERPRFFNPIQIAVDCLVFMLTGELQSLRSCGTTGWSCSKGTHTSPFASSPP